MFLKRFIRPVIKGTLVAGLALTSLSIGTLLSFPEIRQNPTYIPQAMMRLNRGMSLSTSIWWDYYVSHYKGREMGRLKRSTRDQPRSSRTTL